MVARQMALDVMHAPMVSAAPAIPLRDYQQAALAAIRAADGRGVQRQLMVMPTGGGKTIVFSEVVRGRLPGRALILAHRDELIQQARDKFRMVAGDVPVGVVKAERDETGAPVVVASVQTVAHGKRRARLGTDFATVIVDEAHHASAPTYRRVLEHVGAWADEGPLVLGVTATPERSDRVGLGNVFQEVVHEVELLDLIARGYLCDVRAWRIAIGIDLSRIKVTSGDYDAGVLGDAMLESEAHQRIADAIATQAADRTCIVVFTPTVKLAYSIAEAITAKGIPAGAVDGTTPLAERRALLDRWATGEVRVVANCGVLTEGLDVPQLDCVVIARPTKSRALYCQMAGRGLRIAPGKTDCLILDVVGATVNHQLQTSATLTGLPLGQAPECREREQGEGSTMSLLALLRTFGAVVDDKTGTVTAVQVELFSRRWARWLHTGNGWWALPAGDETYLLRPDGAAWEVVARWGAAAPRVIAAGLDLGYAQGMAEERARTSGAVALADKEAAWRTLPPSDRQVWRLHRLGIEASAVTTRGAASDAITVALAMQGVA